MFIEQAYKGKNDWWRTLITTFLATIIFLVNLVAMYFLSDQDMDDLYASMRSIPNNIALAINLAPFAFLLGLLLLLVFILHQRGLLSLTTARSKVDFKRFFFSFGLVILITAIGFGVAYYIDSSEIVSNFKPVNFVILVVISLLLFPVQIGFEEYLFRGYLMQQVGVIVGNRWFPLVLTSVIFGIFHSANPEVAEMGYGIMVFYIGTGLLLGIMTLMDDGLELALGFHLGNNLMAALLITSDFAALQTDALFRYSGAEDTAGMLNEMLLTMAITYPLILFVMAKKFKWTNWKEKLTGRVQSKQQFELIHNPNHDGAVL